MLQVTQAKYQEWESKQTQESLQGFDYDSHQQQLLLRPLLRLPSAGALSCIVRWLREAVASLTNGNPHGWSVEQNKRNDILSLTYNQINRGWLI